MAQPQHQSAPQDKAPQQAGTPLTVTPNDVLGMIQRNAQELISYCWNDPRRIDPNIVMAYLERCWQLTQHLPEPEAPQAGAPNGKGKAS